MNTTWIYTLSDVLQMPLTPQPNGRLTGGLKVRLADAPLQYSLDIVTSHSSPDDLGIILRAERKLYVYVVYTHSKRNVDLYFINADMLSQVPHKEMIAIDCTAESVLEILKPGILKGYYRHKDKGKWINH